MLPANLVTQAQSTIKNGESAALLKKQKNDFGSVWVGFQTKKLEEDRSIRIEDRTFELKKQREQNKANLMSDLLRQGVDFITAQGYVLQA